MLTATEVIFVPLLAGLHPWTRTNLSQRAFSVYGTVNMEQSSTVTASY